MASAQLYYELTLNMARGHLLALYHGTLAGFGWALIAPLLMLTIYTLVFTQIFSARWPGFETSEFFAYNLFVGMIYHSWFAECLQRAPGLVLQSAGLLKRVAFPVPVLAYALVSATAVQALMGFIILFALLITAGVIPGAAALILPLTFIPFALLLVALALFLSALGVYLRDLSLMTGFLSVGLLFLSPIFYPAERVPAAVAPWLDLNPLTLPIETARAAIFDGAWPDPGPWALYCLTSLIAFAVAWVVFNKLKNGFADVI